MSTDSRNELLCPSAQAEIDKSVIFGVVGGTVEEPRVGYLQNTKSISLEVLALPHGLKPSEVFRIAAPCAAGKCQHFDGKDCRLVRRTVEMLPAVVDVLPACPIRGECRWWHQEGKAACMRCPQVVTDICAATELMQAASGM